VADAAAIPSIHVTAGDLSLPGPFYEASAEAAEFGHPGLADIAMFNAMGLDGNGLGT
jgi:2',3'-cyclic-nucleotide 2'-phosphodiesterase (5'-nucleotidase family)